MTDVNANKIQVAKLSDLKTIEAGFKLYKDIFHHIRHDYLIRQTTAGNVFVGFGCIAVIQQLRKGGMVGEYRYSRDEWHLHQFLNLDKANSINPYKFMKSWIKSRLGNSRVFCTNRVDNDTSNKWHEAFGFKHVAKIAWKQGTIPGRVYLFDNTKSVDEFLR
jgi:hypothetical protein